MVRFAVGPWRFAGVVLASLVGCATAPPPTAATTGATMPGAQASLQSAPVPATAPTRTTANDPGSPSVAGQSRTLTTQLATYTSVGFDTVPGWMRDDFSETWPAFLQSCKVLPGRGVEWKQVCDRAAKVDSKSTPAIRNFFESEFSPYQIQDDAKRPDGVVTGYFEPEIQGSRTYSPPYVYPVYARPDDMLILDVRKLPASGMVAARVQGREVVVQPGLRIRDIDAPDLYALDVSTVARNAPDRKARLRIEERRLLPYYTREEIETRGAPHAKVIAFVSSVAALYEMQILGCGRIRLSNGDVIRLAYAERNGHTFRPALAHNASGKPRSAVRTRGDLLELEPSDEDDSADLSSVRLRGFALTRPVDAGAVLVPGRRATGAATGSGIKDPSYVFFKETASTKGGTIGAFGVPLSPGRSIAVDPRTTPLGYPVFVSTRTPKTGAPMQRLTIAQDTGDAIRGAVRADYFFGSDQRAASEARQMKERGQLWILLPRGLPLTTVSSTLRTRGAAAGIDLPQCLVPDEESCVDD
jgi:membrane-bound lytic murein transglycosylase A